MPVAGNTPAEPAPPPDVSVLVPARNAAGDLPRLLAALRAQTLPPERFETVVVDDCSTDETREMAGRAAGVTLVQLESPSGPSTARNSAVAAATGRILAFTDADCVPTATWLEHGLAALERGDADILAGRIEIELNGRPSRAALLDAARHLNQERYASLGWGATANLWMTRETFERVGGFNPHLFPGEDEEFGRRAIAAGARVAYAHDTAVLHPPRERARDLWRKAYRSGVSAAQQRAHAHRALGPRHLIWTRPGAYIPNRGVFGIERLEQRGIAIGPVQRLLLNGLQYFCIQLPIAIGNLAGSVAERRQRAASA
jgi:GT2 family glycosyltransferase